MVKKGKYKLVSFLVENHLLYYKSLKKNGKIIAFAIMHYINFESIESFLNDFLLNRTIRYYSIQIDTNKKNENFLLLNFEDYNKDSIIKAFNLVKQTLGDSCNSARFFKDQLLEIKFFAILSHSINFNTSIKNDSNSIIISTDNNSKILDFYRIDLSAIEKEKSFLSNFVDCLDLNLFGNCRKILKTGIF